MIKMIVVDLDGTLLNRDAKVSMNTKNYLRKLKNEGMIITIATGRIFSTALEATDGAEFANYIITDTGSCIYHPNGLSLFKSQITKETAKKILQYYNEDCKYIDISNKDVSYRYSCDQYSTDSILDECGEIFHMVISLKNNEAVMNLYEKLVRDDISELDIIIMQDSFSDRKWIEMMPKGCSKYHAIKQLSEYLNINNSDIIAFGDSLNDLEMLEKCGYGIAMQNALPEVKQIADAITNYDHNHDGVIRYLREYLDK